LDAKTAFKPLTRREMAKRLADDVPEGWYVNLGIGAPLQVADYVPVEREVVFQSENGVLGMGPAPEPDKINRWLINAGKQYITLRSGGSYMHHADSFALIRGGHLDLCVLGAFQVAENGDIANWMIPGKLVKGMGGAMDLVGGVKKVVVVMEHSAKGESKLLDRCNLPLTGAGVVDLVITDLGVFTIDRKNGSGMTLVELAPDVSLDEVKSKTVASFKVANTLKQ
jgi:3-oxoacid CoA-transferase subunit B